MPAPPSAPVPPARSPGREGLGGWSGLLGGALIAAGALAAYSGSFAGPLLFDDVPSIVNNPTIRRLWPLSGPLCPPGGGITVEGRPVLNFSLALNYALGGTQVWSYHALNLLIHLAAGLALFGIVRRTLGRGAPGATPGAGGDWPARGLPNGVATGLALASALIWTVHPLQSEAVAFVIQRAESLMGLFYLLTLYGFIRAADADEPEPGRRGGAVWLVLSVLACLLGMGAKEVMVSAPVIVLFYDRTFRAGSFGAALRRRAWYYVALGAAWLPLIALASGSGNRGATVGLGSGVSVGDYWLTQFPALIHYLRLTVWPQPLVFDYGTAWVQSLASVWPSALAVLLLAAGTAWAFCRREPAFRALGVLGCWFFAILAPTSLVPSNRQTLAEHRMYLALAPVVVLMVVGGPLWLLRRRGGVPAGNGAAWVGGGILALAVATGLGAVTVRRNRDYGNEERLWGDTVAKNPGNPWAHNNLGDAWLGEPGRTEDAVREFETALRLKPDLPEAHNNLGRAWAVMPGRLDDAIAQFQAALRLNPNLAQAHNNLGNAWLAEPGKLAAAIAEFKAALRLQPDYAEAHYNLGNAWMQVPGRLPEAIAEFQTAVELRPELAAGHNNLGYALYAAGRTPEAIEACAEALRLLPDYWEARFNLALALLRTPGREDEARAQLEAVLRLQPGNDAARRILAGLPPAPGR